MAMETTSSFCQYISFHLVFLFQLVLLFFILLVSFHVMTAKEETDQKEEDNPGIVNKYPIHLTSREKREWICGT